MFSRLTPVGRMTVTAVIIGLLFGGFKLLQSKGYLNAKEGQESVTLNKIDLPDAPKNAASSVPALGLPSSKPAKFSSPEVRWLLWAWNAQMVHC